MKYFLTLFILITTNLNAQNVLTFDKKNVQCEDKWVAYQMDKDSLYTYGFIYVDSQAGLTLNYEGDFKIDKTGKFNKIESDINKELGTTKIRLKPNRVAIAEIPESKFKELKIEKVPNWLKNYKSDENSIERLYRWGYLYNGWNECEKALTYLEKAEKIDSNFKGLQTELAFSYNALEKYNKAEIALNKAIKSNPNDCYSYKELAYTNTKLKQYGKAEECYNKMVSICKKDDFNRETSANLVYEYFKLKDKTNFEKWTKELKKWIEPGGEYDKNLEKMKTEFYK